jgi:hypothetical protein
VKKTNLQKTTVTKGQPSWDKAKAVAKAVVQPLPQRPKSKGK